MNHNIFLIYDIRKHIFSFLRKEPILKCSMCKCVLIWDKSVKEHFIINQDDYFIRLINNGNYCLHCYYKNIKLNCNFS